MNLIFLTHKSKILNNTLIKQPQRHGSKITFPFKEQTALTLIKILTLKLKFDSLNSILFQYTAPTTISNLILGPQVGIVFKTQHNLAYYREFCDYYTERLERILSLYNVDTLDFIIRQLKEIEIIKKTGHLKIGRLSQIELPQRLINISETKTKFNSNILPLTLEEKQFGFFLQEGIRVEYLNDIIKFLKKNNLLLITNNEKNNSLFNNLTVALDNPNFQLRLKDEKTQLVFLREVIKSDRCQVFLTKNPHSPIKIENLLKEAYFIYNKTNILITKAGKELIKAKGLSAASLSLSEIKTQYLQSQPRNGDKLSPKLAYRKDPLLLQTKEITID
jgi:hypothetical protein